MNSFAVELLFFDDLKSLERSIPSYIEFVDHIIAIDGRHTTYQEFKVLSSDGSREYLKSFDKVTLIDMFDYEVNKRKKAKQMCKDLKAENLLIIDSDEYMTGDWNEFISNYDKMKLEDKNHINLYKVELQRYDYLLGYFAVPILFRYPWEFTYYKDKHAIPIKIKDKDSPNIYAPKSFDRPVYGIKIMHDHTLRTKKRMDIRTKNDEWLVRMNR